MYKYAPGRTYTYMYNVLTYTLYAASNLIQKYNVKILKTQFQKKCFEMFAFQNALLF